MRDDYRAIKFESLDLKKYVDIMEEKGFEGLFFELDKNTVDDDDVHEFVPKVLVEYLKKKEKRFTLDDCVYFLMQGTLEKELINLEPLNRQLHERFIPIILTTFLENNFDKSLHGFFCILGFKKYKNLVDELSETELKEPEKLAFAIVDAYLREQFNLSLDDCFQKHLDNLEDRKLKGEQKHLEGKLQAESKQVSLIESKHVSLIVEVFLKKKYNLSLDACFQKIKGSLPDEHQRTQLLSHLKSVLKPLPPTLDAIASVILKEYKKIPPTSPPQTPRKDSPPPQKPAHSCAKKTIPSRYATQQEGFMCSFMTLYNLAMNTDLLPTETNTKPLKDWLNNDCFMELGPDIEPDRLKGEKIWYNGEDNVVTDKPDQTERRSTPPLHPAERITAVTMALEKFLDRNSINYTWFAVSIFAPFLGLVVGERFDGIQWLSLKEPDVMGLYLAYPTMRSRHAVALYKLEPGSGVRSQVFRPPGEEPGSSKEPSETKYRIVFWSEETSYIVTENNITKCMKAHGGWSEEPTINSSVVRKRDTDTTQRQLLPPAPV